MAKNIVSSILGWYPLAAILAPPRILRHSQTCSFLKIDQFLWSGLLRSLLVAFLCKDDCMHPKDGSFLSTTGKELLALDSACYYITHYRVLLWQVRCKVHFLPTSCVKGLCSRRACALWMELTYHLYFFLIPSLGKPKSEPIVFPLTK